MNKRKPTKLIKRPICQEILASWEAVSGEITASVPHLLNLSSAHVTYYRGGARVEVTEGQAVGKREGGKEEVFEGGTRAEFVQWAAAILITGLTVYGPGVNISSIRTMPQTSTISVTLKSLDQMVNPPPTAMAAETLLLSPEFQRKDRWNSRQKREFVGSYLEGVPIPPVYVQRYYNKAHVPAGKSEFDMPDEVLDGKQRLTALLGWFHGEFPAELADGWEIWYRDTDEVDRRAVPMITIHYVDLALVDRLTFYLKLNRGGTPHTDEEIAKVRAMRDALVASQ